MKVFYGNVYVDIDNTICNVPDGMPKMEYDKSEPIYENIEKINRLYDDGNKITYYTARGSVTKIDWYEVTKSQLDSWGCKYHDLSVGDKPPFDLLIDDRSMRIEELRS